MYAGDGLQTKSYLDHFHELFGRLRNELWSDFATSLISFSACMILPFYIFRKIRNGENGRLGKYKIILLFLAALSPLGLCMIGIDFGRWCSAAMWCVFLSGFSLLSIYKNRDIDLPRLLVICQIILLAVICTGRSTELEFIRF